MPQSLTTNYYGVFGNKSPIWTNGRLFNYLLLDFVPQCSHIVWKSEFEKQCYMWRISLWRDAATRLSYDLILPLFVGNLSSNPLYTYEFTEEEICGDFRVTVLVDLIDRFTGVPVARASHVVNIVAGQSLSTPPRDGISLSNGFSEEVALRMAITSHTKHAMGVTPFVPPDGRIRVSRLSLRQPIAYLGLERPVKMFPSGRSLDTAQLDALYFGTSDGTNSAQRIFLTNETLENISLHDVTYISVEDLQLTQDLRDCYKNHKLLVFAQYSRVNPQSFEGTADLFQQKYAGPVTLLGTLTATQGEYISGAELHYPPIGCTCGTSIPWNVECECGNSRPDLSPVRYLRVSVGLLRAPRTSGAGRQRALHVWEVCSAVVDMLGPKTHVNDGLLGVTLSAAPITVNESSLYRKPDDIDDVFESTWPGRRGRIGHEKGERVDVGRIMFRVEERTLHYPISTEVTSVESLLMKYPVNDTVTVADCADLINSSPPSLRSIVCNDLTELNLDGSLLLLSVLSRRIEEYVDESSSSRAAWSWSPLFPHDQMSQRVFRICERAAADELACDLVPIVHRIVHRFVCDSNINDTRGYNVLVNLLRHFHCESALWAFVEHWLQCDSFAELVAHGYFTQRCDEFAQQCQHTTEHAQEPFNWDVQREVLCMRDKYVVEKWDTLIKICWSVRTLVACEYNVGEVGFSMSMLASHLLESVLKYGAVVLRDFIRIDLLESNSMDFKRNECYDSMFKFASKVFQCVFMLSDMLNLGLSLEGRDPTDSEIPVVRFYHALFHFVEAVSISFRDCDFDFTNPVCANYVLDLTGIFSKIFAERNQSTSVSSYLENVKQNLDSRHETTLRVDGFSLWGYKPQLSCSSIVTDCFAGIVNHIESICKISLNSCVSSPILIDKDFIQEIVYRSIAVSVGDVIWLFSHQLKMLPSTTSDMPPRVRKKHSSPSRDVVQGSAHARNSASANKFKSSSRVITTTLHDIIRKGEVSEHMSGMDELLNFFGYQIPVVTKLLQLQSDICRNLSRMYSQTLESPSYEGNFKQSPVTGDKGGRKVVGNALAKRYLGKLSKPDKVQSSPLASAKSSRASKLTSNGNIQQIGNQEHVLLPFLAFRGLCRAIWEAVLSRECAYDPGNGESAQNHCLNDSLISTLRAILCKHIDAKPTMESAPSSPLSRSLCIKGMRNVKHLNDLFLLNLSVVCKTYELCASVKGSMICDEDEVVSDQLTDVIDVPKWLRQDESVLSLCMDYLVLQLRSNRYLDNAVVSGLELKGDNRVHECPEESAANQMSYDCLTMWCTLWAHLMRARVSFIIKCLDKLCFLLLDSISENRTATLTGLENTLDRNLRALESQTSFHDSIFQHRITCACIQRNGEEVMLVLLSTALSLSVKKYHKHDTAFPLKTSTPRTYSSNIEFYRAVSREFLSEKSSDNVIGQHEDANTDCNLHLNSLCSRVRASLVRCCRNLVTTCAGLRASTIYDTEGLSVPNESSMVDSKFGVETVTPSLEYPVRTLNNMITILGNVIDECLLFCVPECVTALPLFTDTHQQKFSIATGNCSVDDIFLFLNILKDSFADVNDTVAIKELHRRMNLRLYSWTVYVSTHAILTQQVLEWPECSNENDSSIRREWCSIANASAICSQLERSFNDCDKKKYSSGVNWAGYSSVLHEAFSHGRIDVIMERCDAEKVESLERITLLDEVKDAVNIVLSVLELIKCRSQLLVGTKSCDVTIASHAHHSVTIRNTNGRQCEEQHQQLRLALRYFLLSGHWEFGSYLIKLFSTEYNFAIGMGDPPHSHESHDFPPIYEKLKSTGNKRLLSLVEELNRADDKFKDRLLHEGDIRPRPLYYAIRFMTNPWNSSKSSSQLSCDGDTDPSMLSNLRKFFLATEYSFVEVTKACSMHCNLTNVDGIHRQQDLNPSGGHTKKCESPDFNCMGSIGIGSGEIWLIVKYDCLAYTNKSSCSNYTEKMLDCIDSGGPIGSYARLVWQLEKAFPDYYLAPSESLYVNRINSDSTIGCAYHNSKVLQVFKAYPNISFESDEHAISKFSTSYRHGEIDKQSGSLQKHDPSGSAGLYSQTRRNVSICGEVLDFTTRARTGSALDVMVKEVAHEVVHGIDSRDTGAGRSWLRHLSQVNRKGSVCDSVSMIGREMANWEVYSHCDSFTVHAKLHESLYERKNDECVSTVTLVLNNFEISSSKGHDAAISSDGEAFRAKWTDSLVAEGSGGDELLNILVSQVHCAMPCRLAHFSSAYVFPSVLCHMYSILRNNLRQVLHCMDLLNHFIGADTVDTTPQDDISSSLTVLQYVTACMSDVIMHTLRSEGPGIFGLHSASSLICAENERRNILWQHKRRLIKREYVARKSIFDRQKQQENDKQNGDEKLSRESITALQGMLFSEDAKTKVDDVSLGLVEPDINALEIEFLATLDAKEEVYLAAMGLGTYFRGVIASAERNSEFSDSVERKDDDDSDRDGWSVYDKVCDLKDTLDFAVVETLKAFRNVCYNLNGKNSSPSRADKRVSLTSKIKKEARTEEDKNSPTTHWLQVLSWLESEYYTHQA